MNQSDTAPKDRGSRTALEPGQTFELRDQSGTNLGTVVVESSQEDIILGNFVPTAAFAALEPIFTEHTECVNEQAFCQADELEAKIAQMGLQLGSSNGMPAPAIEDVQILVPYVSFRLKRP